MQQYLGSIHHSAIINNDQLANLLEEAVMMRDLPGMADVDSSLLWFCEQMKQDYTVALSGECADEIFGGYPWFYKEEFYMERSFRGYGPKRKDSNSYFRIGKRNSIWKGM